MGVSGSTNTLKVHVMGNVLVTGRGHINNRRVCGTVCVCRSEAEVREKFKSGDILVIPETSNKIIDVLRQRKGNRYGGGRIGFPCRDRRLYA